MKYGIVVALALLLACFSLLSFNEKTTDTATTVTEYYGRALQQLKWQLSLFKSDVQEGQASSYKTDFRKCRIAYKNIEAFVSYYYPYAETRMNGPAVFEVEPSDFSEINYPTGFQVAEALLYEDEEAGQQQNLLKQIDYLLNYTNLLQRSGTTIKTDAATVLDMVRINLYGMASKGLSGFDSPVAYLGIEEAKTTFYSSLKILEAAGIKDEGITASMHVCIAFLDNDKVTFDDFNRAGFLSGPFRKALAALYAYQKESGIPFLKSKGAVRKDVFSFMEPNAFDAYFFATDSLQKPDSNRIRLGKRLFNEPGLSLGNRSCASCHKPELAFTDGLTKNTSLQKTVQILRNTPTIINAALQPVLFYDGRSKSLEDQAHEVLLNKDEMDGQLEAALTLFSKDMEYKKAFKSAYPDDGNLFTKSHVLQAIADYERSLVQLNAPFDLYMQGNAAAMKPEQIKGFNLFMGKAKCGTCHYMPLFNGVVPPLYKKSDTEIIGVPEKYGVTHARLDNDLGAYNYFHNDIKQYAFKTPGLRNVARTAPYMHNGSFKTLAEVMDFYNNGGGRGLGLDIPNQTLPEDNLNLTSLEKKEIIAFLNALSNY